MNIDKAIAILELPKNRNFTRADVKNRYRLLAQRNHPDKGGSNALFKILKEAKDVLQREMRRPGWKKQGASPGSASGTKSGSTSGPSSGPKQGRAGSTDKKKEEADKKRQEEAAQKRRKKAADDAKQRREEKAQTVEELQEGRFWHNEALRLYLGYIFRAALFVVLISGMTYFTGVHVFELDRKWVKEQLVDLGSWVKGKYESISSPAIIEEQNQTVLVCETVKLFEQRKTDPDAQTYFEFRMMQVERMTAGLGAENPVNAAVPGSGWVRSMRKDLLQMRDRDIYILISNMPDWYSGEDERAYFEKTGEAQTVRNGRSIMPTPAEVARGAAYCGKGYRTYIAIDGRKPASMN